MIPTLTCLAIACVGVEFGYQPASRGGLELIVQIDRNTFQTLRENDPISVAVPTEAQSTYPSQITLVLGNAALPHTPPRETSPRASASVPSATAAPATAPVGPAAPMPAPSVLPTTAAMPLPSASGPALGPPGEQGPVHVAPPAGESVAPRTTNEQSQGAAGVPARGSRASAAAPGGRPDYEELPRINSGKPAASPSEHPWLLMCLLVIGLAASNGYVGWLFYDARQRYLGLLSRTFATGHATST